MAEMSICVVCKALFQSEDEMKGHLLATHNGKEVADALFGPDDEPEEEEGEPKEEVKEKRKKKRENKSKKTRKKHRKWPERTEQLLDYGPQAVECVMCPICSKNFRTPEWLDVHLKHIHQVGGTREMRPQPASNHEEKPHRCSLCGAGFSLYFALERHLRHHEQMQCFDCDWCDKSFFSQKYLQQHLRLHNNMKQQYRCSICRKTFVAAQGLASHFRKHSRQRNSANAIVQSLN